MSTLTIILVVSFIGLLVCLNPFRKEPDYGRGQMRTTIKNSDWSPE